MTELNQIFDGDWAQLVFFVGSTIFVTIYACGFVLQRSNQREAPPFAYPGRIAMVALFLVAIICTIAGIRLGPLNSGQSEAAIGPASLSISDLHTTVNVGSLPVQQVEEPF